jgi:hypothetical protein
MLDEDKGDFEDEPKEARCRATGVNSTKVLQN